MALEFAPSARGSVGLEWELMLADRVSGDLTGYGPQIVDSLADSTAHERFTVTGELLTNTVEVTSGVGKNVEEAVDDIADAISAVRSATNDLGLELLSAGSHPFARWYRQTVTDSSRYQSMIDRTQWWGRNMMIWGIHVHIGVEDRSKVMPIIHALSAYLPHLQALSASSPYWAGEDTGYASNRALVFQQLPTAGLPWNLHTWSEFESYLEDMQRTGVMADETEVRWDIRPAPRWGTIELRACDGMSTLPELAAIAALTQTLVEKFSRDLDEGRELPILQPWFVRENKWRAARFGLEADVITDQAGTTRNVVDHLRETVEELSPVAAELHCQKEFAGVTTILDQGASYSRQRRVADATDGDLTEVVQHLIREFRQGPTLRERLREAN